MHSICGSEPGAKRRRFERGEWSSVGAGAEGIKLSWNMAIVDGV